MEKISDILRRRLLQEIESGRETRYSIAKKAEIDLPAFIRFLDSGSDVRVSTVDALAGVLGLTLLPASKRKVDS